MSAARILVMASPPPSGRMPAHRAAPPARARPWPSPRRYIPRSCSSETATSATGTCQGPTIWSRLIKPLTVRSPMVIKNDLSAIVGRHNNRSSESLNVLPSVDKLTGDLRDRAGIAHHARRLAEQYVNGHVDRRAVQQRIGNLQQPVAGYFADHGERAALALAQGLELSTLPGTEREHVALLRLVAPDLHRRELRFGAGNFAQVDPAAAMAVRNGLRQRVRQSAGAHVVDEQNGIRIAQARRSDRSPLERGVVFPRCRAAPRRNPSRMNFGRCRATMRRRRPIRSAWTGRRER